MKVNVKTILLRISILAILFAFIPVTPTATAGALDAKLDKVELISTPNCIGVGGEVTLRAEAFFYGGCCYHLWAYDISANISLPGDIDLISGPAPEIYQEVDAYPGGEPAIVHFTWKVRSMTVGAYDLNVTIDTKNCGSVSGTNQLKVVHGCAISEPAVFHSSGGDTLISFHTESFLEGITVEGVELYYLKMEGTKKGTDSLRAENGSLFMGDTEHGGIGLEAEPAEFSEGLWSSTMRTPKERSTVYYWIVAVDNHGEKTTSPVYIMEVEDEEKIDAVVNYTFVGLFFGSILGIALIVVAYMRLSRDHVSGTSKRGLSALGMSRIPGIIENFRGTTVDTAFQRKLASRRMVIGATIAVIGLAFLIWAILTGRFEDLIAHIEEGK